MMYKFYRWMYGLVGFSRSQSNGFLVFLPLMIIILFSEPVFRWWQSDRILDHSSDVRQLDSLIASWPTSTPSASPRQKKANKLLLSAFNPNMADDETLRNAGLSKALVTRIINYRKKGGTFKRKEDLLKIYGMDSLTYAGVEEFISIPKEKEKPPYDSRKIVSPKISRPIVLIDLNKADTATLKKVFGIGDKLSVRILKYRDALGGFITWQQLSEVYRLDSVTINKIKKSFFIQPDYDPKKLIINVAGRQELATHPYLSTKAADAIVAYRFQHGGFKSIDELRKMPVIDSATFEKILPYVKLNE